jgi:hypothetical protein
MRYCKKSSRRAELHTSTVQRYSTSPLVMSLRARILRIEAWERMSIRLSFPGAMSGGGVSSARRVCEAIPAPALPSTSDSQGSLVTCHFHTCRMTRGIPPPLVTSPRRPNEKGSTLWPWQGARWGRTQCSQADGKANLCRRNCPGTIQPLLFPVVLASLLFLDPTSLV